jgi:hypothetical protein
MPRYFFLAHYHDTMVVDDLGEEFSTLREAQAHAAMVARELSRNDSPEVAVTVLRDDKIHILNRARR